MATAKTTPTKKGTKIPPPSGIMTVGRRKTAVAQVTLVKSKNPTMTINKLELQQYFPIVEHQLNVQKPLQVTSETLDQKNQYKIVIDIRGGGKTAQSEAARLAIARALDLDLPKARPILKKADLLRRDSRMVERKKYGHHKARKGTQFSKR